MAEPLRPDVTETGIVPEPVERVFRRVAAAFHSRDFRVIWFGAFTSSTGAWMQKVAQGWLVLTLTNNPYYLGLDAFLGELPILLFTLIGGVVADRRNRRQVLLTSQYIQMASALVLAALVYWNVVRIWHILTLSFITGFAQAFGGPAYQALIAGLVAKKDLPNAIALNSIQFNLARVIGSSLASLAMATLGITVCFTLNGLSFLVVIVALLSIRVSFVPDANRQPMMKELKGGLSYVGSHGPLQALTILAAATTFLGIPLLTLLPVFVKNVFQGDAVEYARMMAFSGIGAVGGALVVAWLGHARKMGLTLLAVQAVLGVLTIAFAFSRSLWLSYLLLGVSGGALIILFSLVTSLVQLIAPNEMRGRVMSIYMVAFRGGMPLGSLASGYLASVSGAPIVVAVNGALLALVALYFVLKNHGIKDL